MVERTQDSRKETRQEKVMISWAKILRDHCPVTVEKYKTATGRIIYSATLGKPSVRFCGEKWENLQKRIDSYLKMQEKI